MPSRRLDPAWADLSREELIRAEMFRRENDLTEKQVMEMWSAAVQSRTEPPTDLLDNKKLKSHQCPTCAGESNAAMPCIQCGGAGRVCETF